MSMSSIFDIILILVTETSHFRKNIARFLEVDVDKMFLN